MGVYIDVLKVSTKSNPNSGAGALTGVLRENGFVELQAIGAGAINQAIKVIAISRGFVVPSGDGEQKTAIKLLVEIRK